MNPRLVVTASLLPLAALALAVAPVLAPSAEPVPSGPVAHHVPNPTPPPPPVVEAAGVHLTVTPDRPTLYAGGDRRMRVRVDWWADPSATATVTPTDLVVILDRSGSMDGEKMLDARAAAAELVSQLGPEDRFSLVSFASDVRVDVPLSAGTDRATWTHAIDRVASGGSTGMVQGLRAGLAQAVPVAGRSRRVVLVSDGRPDGVEGLEALAASSARAETPLTAIGIGLDYDEALMQSLADRGAGNFYWARRGPELQQVLANELSAARRTVASGIRLGSVGGATVVEAGGLPVHDGSVDLGTLYAGQKRSLWVTVEVPGQGETAPLGSFTLAFTPSEGQPVSLVTEAPRVALVSDPARAYASLGDGWADSVVTEDYNRLRTVVSGLVQAGDQDAALAAIRSYRLDNEALNAHAGNVAVADNLKEVGTLEAEVQSQFVGEDQAARQNTWSKGTRVDAYSKRRVGQVMPAPFSR